MHMPAPLRAFAFATGVAVLGFGTWAIADPPSRVARVGYMTGTVSFSPAGEDDWIQATVNRPLTTGDRLWADTRSRAEIQVGGAMVRMDAGTSVSILNLDDRIAQLQLTQGALNVRVRRLERDQMVEVATPNLAFTIRQAGAFRIEVDPDGTATTIVVRDGRGEVYGEGASYVIDARQPYRFAGTGLREYQYVDAPRLDEFDRWAGDRDRSYDNSVSARYVSQDVVGYQDLDANGTWRVDATYGNVWFPSRVGADWAPYRDGHWAWVDPWGWTWVDDAPWGFAVSHYGRWTNLRGTWGWVPGPVRTRAYYAPALVMFVGGDNFQLSLSGGGIGGVAWFPLGPREVYRPAYPVSRGYFDRVNRSNTVINTTVINNYYNNTNVTNVVYANQRVPGAVVAVPTTVFAQSQPVSRATVRVRQEVIASAPVAAIPSIAPTDRSVRGGAARAGDTPPSRAFARPVVARTAPPAAAPGFAAQQRQLEAKPGKPLDDATRRQLKPVAAPAQAQVVRVVEPTQKAPPTMRPPPAESAAKLDDGRGKPEPRGPAEQRAQPVASPPTAQPTEQRGRAEQRGTTEQRVPPVTPTPPQQRAAEPKATVPPPVAAPTPTRPPTAPQADQRGRAEQRGTAEQRVQPVAPPPPPQRAAEPKDVPPPVAASQGTPRPPTAQPAEQRARSEARGNADQRVQPAAPPPSPQRAAEPKPVPPQRTAPVPVKASAPQQSAPPSAASPPQSAPSAPAAQQPAQRAKPKPAPDAELSKPAAGKSSEKGKDGDDPKRDEESRKPKG
jgi:hypothetical protein